MGETAKQRKARTGNEIVPMRSENAQCSDLSSVHCPQTSDGYVCPNNNPQIAKVIDYSCNRIRAQYEKWARNSI